MTDAIPRKAMNNNLSTRDRKALGKEYEWAERTKLPNEAKPPATSAEYAMGYAEGFNDGCKPKPQAEPLDKLTATAPREIWLQVSDEPRDAENGFPADVEGITWCAESVLSEEVRYVREDLAHPAAPAPAVQSAAKTIANEQSYDTGLWFVATTVTEAHLQAALRRLTYAVEAPAPQAEPIAWVGLEDWQSGACWPDDCFSENQCDGYIPLYTHPAAPVPAVPPNTIRVNADELVAYEYMRKIEWGRGYKAGKASTPQPVALTPLTNGEIYTAYITATNQTLRPQDERLALDFARAVEAAHGIKGETP